MNRKTDAELLLGLFGECDCCCDCEQKAQQQAAQRAGRPLRPQVLGKKAQPLRIILDDQPFVPALYPERETPQLPEPNHAPFVAAGPVYAEIPLSGESGFQTGVLLDSGDIDARYFGSIDHVARLARLWTGTTSYTDTYDLAKTAVRVVGNTDALPLDPAPRGTFVFSDTPGPPGALFSYDTQPTLASMKLNQVEVAGIGFCHQGSILRGRLSPVSLGISRAATYQEANGVFFDGTAFHPAPVAQTITGTIIATPLKLLSELDTAHEITEGTDGSGNPTYRHRTIFTELDRPASDGQLRMIRNTWVDANAVAHDVFYLLDMGLPTTRSLDYWYRNPNPAGVTWLLGHLDVPGAATVIGNPIDAYASGPPLGNPVQTTFADGTPVEWTEYVVDGVMMIPDVSQLPQMTKPLPTVVFQSPVLNGRNFSIVLDDITARSALALEPEQSLVGMQVQVNGAVFGSGWLTFGAFRTKAGGQTLLLGTSSSLTILPELDTSQAIEVNWADLLVSLGYEGTEKQLAGHLGYHSYPEDRAYLLIENTLGAFWLALGEWDAFRDVSAAAWKLAGLSKPRMRALFEAGQARVPPAPLPPKPAHGLAVYDIFLDQGVS
ncbi:hypothetical protein [Deinococcus ruber]|uniref:Uncharacterized protein n=1 Tax=Deinococcus ruber TaxID=1848197 RepID=A0A918FDP5_9DEIO|nr:hypothetical protein [Deinococcus ruber]GGR34162.1 hypothetical protein GCM10008957_50460 [Deinococcus ruber]